MSTTSRNSAAGLEDSFLRVEPPVKSPSKPQALWPVLIYFVVLFFALTLWFDHRF
jgi:hypothetical protein